MYDNIEIQRRWPVIRIHIRYSQAIYFFTTLMVVGRRLSLAKKIRKSVLAGQIALIILGAFLLLVSFAIYETMQSARWSYSGPPPALYGIPGIICMIIGVLLFSVLRYEAK